MEGWQIQTLGNICHVIAGQSPSSHYYNTKQIGLPFYQGKKDFGEKYIKESKYWTTHTTKLAQKGDILMSVRAPVGPINYATGDICIGRGLAAIRCKEYINRDYLYYYLLRLQPELKGNEGAVFASINKQDIESIVITYPPLPEQQRTVAILDEAFEGIKKAKANAEKNLQNARELFEGYLQSVFTQRGEEWLEKRLEDLGIITSSKRIYKSDYVENGIPFYRTKEIKELSNNKSISLELFITHEKYNEIKRKYGVPEAGDILISAVGTIGEIYVVKSNDKFYFKDGNIVWLRNFNSVDTNYLKYALKSFVEQIKMLTRGTAYNALTIEKLKEYKVPIASISEQRIIVKKLDSINAESRHLETIYTKKIAALDELNKSLLDQAFIGKL